MQRMKYKDFEIDFGKKLAEAREEAGVVNEIKTDTIMTPEEENRIIELACISPRAAVVESWREVNLAMFNTAKKLFGKDFLYNNNTYQSIVRKLGQDERIDRKTHELINKLRLLRNQAAHSHESSISSDTALEYARMAKQLVVNFETIVESVNDN